MRFVQRRGPMPEGRQLTTIVGNAWEIQKTCDKFEVRVVALAVLNDNSIVVTYEEES